MSPSVIFVMSAVAPGLLRSPLTNDAHLPEQPPVAIHFDRCQIGRSELLRSYKVIEELELLKTAACTVQSFMKRFVLV